MSSEIISIVMPKWGLSMKEGTLTEWNVSEGDYIEPGQEIMEVETDKISSAVEAPDGGLLRRIVSAEGCVYKVKALLGVIAPEEVSDEEIDAFISTYEINDEDDEEEDSAPDYEFIETASGLIRYSFRPGEGTPIIFIHGFGGDLDNWMFNIDAVSKSGPTYALDLPGHGQSTKSIKDASLEFLTDAVENFLTELLLTKVNLVGHSMGGLIASNFSLRNTVQVNSLTLISPAGIGSEVNTNYIDGFVSSTSRKELKPILSLLFADPSLVSRTMVDDLLKYKRLDGVQNALEGIAGELFSSGKQTTVLADQLNGLEIPIQLIWGKQDKVISVSHTQNLSNAEIEIIDDVGHMAQMEAASRVNDLINIQASK